LKDKNKIKKRILSRNKRIKNKNIILIKININKQYLIKVNKE
jgi:hypothetical protein